MVRVGEAMVLLETAVDSGAVATICREQSVDLLVLFGSALTSVDPGDIDLAVAFVPKAPRDQWRCIAP